MGVSGEAVVEDGASGAIVPDEEWGVVLLLSAELQAAKAPRSVV